MSRIFRYLKFTAPMGIVYKYSLSNVDNQLVLFRSPNYLVGLGNPVLSGYSDADIARDIDTRRSTSGLILCWQVHSDLLTESCTGYYCSIKCRG